MKSDKKFAIGLIKHVKKLLNISTKDYHNYYVATHPLTKVRK